MDYFLFNFSGVQFHYTMSPKIKERILKFVEQNKLHMHGGIYLFPLRNFWSTSKPEEELVKLCLRVEYTD